MNLKSLHARLEKLEQSVSARPTRFRYIMYYSPLNAPRDEHDAAYAAALAEEVEKNGPIRESDFLLAVHIVNAPRAETVTGPPQDAPETQTAPEAMQSAAKGHSI